MALKWKKFRPLRAWLVVKADPKPTRTFSGIEIPDISVRVEKTVEGTGTILKLGPEVRTKCGFGLEPGMRICYRGFLKDAMPYFEPVDNCPVFLLSADDVLADIDKDVRIGM